MQAPLILQLRFRSVLYTAISSDHRSQLTLRLRDLVDKAVVVAGGLGNCGLANQEQKVSHLGAIAARTGEIRDETHVCI